jgi:uncharacterized protein
VNSATQKLLLAGATGAIECLLDLPSVQPVGLAVVAHPHPLFGGTADNKVVQTIARALLELGFAVVRPNFRGVGASEGVHDEGRGETDDMATVIAHFRVLYAGRLVLAGFSFGAAVISQAAASAAGVERLVLVGPAVRFNLATVTPDSVVIHGETDDVVLLASVLDWARPLGVPVIVVPGVGHFFHGQLPLLKKLVLRNFGSFDAK